MSRITGDRSTTSYIAPNVSHINDKNVTTGMRQALEAHFGKKKGLLGTKHVAVRITNIDLRITDRMSEGGKLNKVTGTVHVDGKPRNITRSLAQKLGTIAAEKKLTGEPVDFDRRAAPTATPVPTESFSSAENATQWGNNTRAALAQVMDKPQYKYASDKNNRLTKLISQAWNNGRLGDMPFDDDGASGGILPDDASGTSSMYRLMPPTQPFGGLSPARESSPTLGSSRSDYSQVSPRPNSATPPSSRKPSLETLRPVAYNAFNAQMLGASNEALAAPTPVRYQTAIFTGDDISPRRSFESAQSGGDGWRPPTGESAHQPLGWSTGSSSNSPMSSNEWSGERSTSVTPPSSASPGPQQMFSSPVGSDGGRVSPLSYRSYSSSLTGSGSRPVSPLSERSLSPGPRDGRESRLSMGRPSDVSARSMYLQLLDGEFSRPVYAAQVIPDAPSSYASSVEPPSRVLSAISEESSRWAPSEVAYKRAVSPRGPNMTGSEALFLAAKHEGTRMTWSDIWRNHDATFAGTDLFGGGRAAKPEPKKQSTTTRMLTSTRTWAKNLFSRR